MNYHLSKKVKEKIELYKLIQSQRQMSFEGFLIGDRIGNIPIIEDIFFIDFDIDNLDLIYPILLETYGERLLGSIFFGKKRFSSDWFLEDLVLEF